MHRRVPLRTIFTHGDRPALISCARALHEPVEQMGYPAPAACTSIQSHLQPFFRVPATPIHPCLRTLGVKVGLRLGRTACAHASRKLLRRLERLVSRNPFIGPGRSKPSLRATCQHRVIRIERVLAEIPRSPTHGEIGDESMEPPPGSGAGALYLFGQGRIAAPSLGGFTEI